MLHIYIYLYIHIYTYVYTALKITATVKSNSQSLLLIRNIHILSLNRRDKRQACNSYKKPLDYPLFCLPQPRTLHCL